MSNYDKSNVSKRYLKNVSFKELIIIRNNIFWVDTVNNGQNINKGIFTRPFNDKNAEPQQLTSDEFNIQSKFHGYGGDSYKCIYFRKHFYLIWIDQRSRALWMQIFESFEITDKSCNRYLRTVSKARQLCESMECNFDSSFVLTENNFLYGICEIRNKDFLFSLNIDRTKQDINLIKQFNSFAGDLSSNFSDNLISWTEWGMPYMPWERNKLFFAEIDCDGGIKNTKEFIHKSINESKNCSFFQPFWISDNFLVCSEDSSGWWNLLFIDVSNTKNILIKHKIRKDFTEYGLPQWVSGITLFSGSLKNLFCLAKKSNKWLLEQYKDFKLFESYKLPFCSISEFSVYGKKVVIKGFSENSLDSLIELDLQDEISTNILKELCFETINEYSKPESFWFQGFGNQLTHSFIYRPLFERFSKPPLLIKAHSGPTSCFDGSYNAEVQYWSSKGFLVAEVNYGGSSGFGKNYRDRLNNKWGIVDSYDCKSLVIELIKLGLVDSKNVVILGNSAGGLTALNSLCDSDFFKAAICKYPVIDLKDMLHNTHRFEKDYLNSLIGNYQQFSDDYEIRSPINKIRKIKKPILLFHGKQDLVISYKQLLKIKKQLIQNNKYSEVIFFENEGHGFKNSETKREVMQKIEEFLNKVFNI